MKNFWQKRLFAFFLALVLVLGLMPAALAADCTGAHDWGEWQKVDETHHERRCLVGSCTQTERVAHTWSSSYFSDAAAHWTECTVCKAQQGNAAHGFLPALQQNAASHWEQCQTCGYHANEGGHIDNTPDGKCDTCGYNMGSPYVTVTFWNGSAAFQTQSNVLKGGYPATPGTPAYPGGSYTFLGWTTANPGSTAAYTGQAYYTSAQVAAITVNANTTYYAVYDIPATQKITYITLPGEAEPFDAEDFNDAYQDGMDTRNDIRWVEFSVPSSYSGFEGAIYLDYGKATQKALSRSDLNGASFYYEDAEDGDYALDALSLVADAKAYEDAFSIDFTAYRSSGNYVDGTLELVVDEDGADVGSIVYKVIPGKTVDFDRADFNAVFREDYPNDTVLYVVFDRPTSAAFAAGELYSDYGSIRNEEVFTRNSLDGLKFYYDYSNATVGDYDLSVLTFAADSDFKDTVTLTFTAYGSGSRFVEGSVEIRATSDDDADIAYSVAPGKTVDFDRADFNRFFRQKYRNKTFDYVVFNRPDSQVFADAALYSNYGSSRNETLFSRSDLNQSSFYYDGDDATGSREYELDSLTFVADRTFTGAVRLPFTAYGTGGDAVSGVLVVKASTSGTEDDLPSTLISSYAGNLRYSVAAGTNVQLSANDVARFFKQTYPTDTLQYVQISGVPAIGGLYYNYYGASAYGVTARTQLTAANCKSQMFYASPAATSQYALTELTYVPSGANYCVAIPFVAYGTVASRTVSGIILISVTNSAVAEVYGITPKNTAVNFPASSLYSAVFNATSSALHSIQLLSLPSAGVGTIYVGGGTAAPATATAKYTYASGTQSISQLRFVPAAGYTGSVSIPYVALNSSGTAIGSGVFALGVVNSIKRFSDVTSATWCYKYVAELSDAGIIGGYADNSFKPDSTITYGAALKLIMLAAGYPEQAPTGSNVFSGYLARAQADGLITRSNVDLGGSITRLQVAQLAASALKLDLNSLSSVKPFTDTTDPHVQALNAAGIVEGYFSNGVSSYRPNGTLTRGQVSAIVWRMYNYRK